MKTKMIMLCLVLGSWGAFAQDKHACEKGDKKMMQSEAMFKDAKLGSAYEQYVHVKDALVASNADDAKMGAMELLGTIKEAGGSAAAVDAATKIATSSDIKEQREAFSTLSYEMTTLLKGGKLSMGMLYVDYCPMANGAGAYWVSSQKEIRNPYFGKAMPKCGSVSEMIH